MATEDPAPSPEERIAGLEEENERLRAQVEELLQEREEAAQAVKGAGGLAARVLLGRRLRTSFRDWLKAKSLQDPLPADETADVMAAIVRRVIRVGIVGLIIAALPGAFLLWQNVLIRQQNAAIQQQIELQVDQNAAIRSQIKQQAAQVKEQAEDTLIVRRAQLLATIYEEDCGDEPPADQATVATQEAPDRICRPKAPLRVRQEAALAFAEIERGRGVVLDLRGADLREATLSGAILRGANLHETTLSAADLRSADLSEATLIGAILNGADIVKANLFRANLFRADLSEAILSGADLSEAILSGADLSKATVMTATLNGADLSEADLRGATFMGADFSGAILRGADVVKANLFRANLFRADLREAILNEADLRGADLRRADLRTTRGLSQDHVNQAHGDVDTLLPEGLERPEHWTSEDEDDPPERD